MEGKNPAEQENQSPLEPELGQEIEPDGEIIISLSGMPENNNSDLKEEDGNTDEESANKINETKEANKNTEEEPIAEKEEIKEENKNIALDFGNTADEAGGENQKTDSEKNDPLSKMFEDLEKYRNTSSTNGTNGICIFQNKENKVIDGINLIAALDSTMEKVKGLHTTLSKTGELKEQFVIKQEILKTQEKLNMVLTSAKDLNRNKSYDFPSFTSEILNGIVLTNFINTMETHNWSDQEDFAKDDKFITKLKNKFNKKIDPPSKYIQSLIEDLESA
jgi:hypothetical protein